MVTTNDSFLKLNIVPATVKVKKYNQDQLFLAVEDEYYKIRDNVDQAIINLVRNLANETSGNITLPINDSGYDKIPLNKGGLNVPPTATNFALTMVSYNTVSNALTFGLPDGFGARFGGFQLPWMDAVLAAGNGKSIPILEDFLRRKSVLTNIAIKTPSFDAAWKAFSDKAWLLQHQKDYMLDQTNSILYRVKKTVAACKNWDIDNIPASLKATLMAIYTGNNLGLLKNVSFMNNACRGLPDIVTVPAKQVWSYVSTEKIFGADKYITDNARRNIIPMDYGDLQQARAEGAIREKLLGEKLIDGDTTSLKEESADDIRARIYADYSSDRHIQNRMDGINAGEEPLPNTRTVVDEVDDNGKVIVKNPAPTGFNGEYIPDENTRGCGGLEGRSDYSPLALGEPEDCTPIEKENARARTGITTADGSTWGEQNTGYNTQYPNNEVIEKNGIVIEIDKTPGSERIHVYHPSHTYISIDNEGNLKIRNAKDKFELVDRDMKEYIKNNYDRTVDGNRTSKVTGSETQQIGGNLKITAARIDLN